MAYSTINKSKFGNCSICPAKDIACIKRKKDLICIPCVRRIDGKEQVNKAQEKEKLRRGGNTSKVSPKTLAGVRGLVNDNPDVKPPKDYAELDRWFKDRRKEMTNTCCECGKGTNKFNDTYYKWSCCHIVPKSLVKSVATNEYNFIELCQQHHQEFDSTFDRAEKMMCFGEVKMKFQLFKHLIPAEEMRKINPHLLKDA